MNALDTVLTAASKTLMLSHGTLECRKLLDSEKFYREFLGLQTVLRGKMSVWFRCGGYWMVASVATGEKQESLPIASRWRLDLHSPEAVDAAHQAARDQADRFQIKEILPVAEDAGLRSFCLRDLDGNWWEIGCRRADFYDSVFAKAQA